MLYPFYSIMSRFFTQKYAGIVKKGPLNCKEFWNPRDKKVFFLWKSTNIGVGPEKNPKSHKKKRMYSKNLFWEIFSNKKLLILFISQRSLSLYNDVFIKISLPEWLLGGLISIYYLMLKCTAKKSNDSIKNPKKKKKKKIKLYLNFKKSPNNFFSSSTN